MPLTGQLWHHRCACFAELCKHIRSLLTLLCVRILLPKVESYTFTCLRAAKARPHCMHQADFARPACLQPALAMSKQTPSVLKMHSLCACRFSALQTLASRRCLLGFVMPPRRYCPGQATLQLRAARSECCLGAVCMVGSRASRAPCPATRRVCTRIAVIVQVMAPYVATQA